MANDKCPCCVSEVSVQALGPAGEEVEVASVSRDDLQTLMEEAKQVVLAIGIGIGVAKTCLMEASVANLFLNNFCAAHADAVLGMLSLHLERAPTDRGLADQRRHLANVIEDMQSARSAEGKPEVLQ